MAEHCAIQQPFDLYFAEGLASATQPLIAHAE